MKYLASLMLVLFSTSLYSMDAEKLDHQRTPQERALRVERINTYLKEIVECEQKIEESQSLVPKLEYAIKVGNISLNYLNIYKADITNILNKLYAIQDDFKSIYFSEDNRIKDFKETVRTLHKHRQEETSLLAKEGCVSSQVDVYFNSSSSHIYTQRLRFSAFDLDEFEALTNLHSSKKVSDFFTPLKSTREAAEDMHISSYGDIQKLSNYLIFSNSQIETLKAKKKEKIRLMHTNLDWFDVD